jgi:hypothetical protein
MRAQNPHCGRTLRSRRRPPQTLSRMREAYFSSRDRRRGAWVAFQVALVLPLMLSAGVVLEMTFARPGEGYRSASGVEKSCEALAPRYKSYTAPRCATFGSMETNPLGFGIAVASLAALGAAVWLACRPGHGLRFARRGY